MLSSMSSSLLWRELLAIAIGVISVAWPNITIGALVLLFAVYAFIAAGAESVRAFRSDTAGPVVGYLLLSVLSLAAGITAEVLTIWVAAWALVTGIVEVALAFQRNESAGERAMWGAQTHH